MNCRLAGSENIVVKSSTERGTTVKPEPWAEFPFDYKNMTTLNLEFIDKKHLLDEVKDAINPKMICRFMYDEEPNPPSKKSLQVEMKSHLNYDHDAKGHIIKRPKEAGDRTIFSTRVEQGKPVGVRIEVNELSEVDVSPSGDRYPK